MATTYLSHEDSELLRQASRSYRGIRCIEIGIGYGSNLVEMKGKYDMLVGTDVSKTEAFERDDMEGINLIRTDIASCVRSGTFDLVLMNPPYLPSSSIEDSTVDGGKHDGFEIPERFLVDALRIIKPNGRILLVISSETSVKRFERFCEENQLVFRAILRKHLFFEDLLVYELQKLTP